MGSSWCVWWSQDVQICTSFVIGIIINEVCHWWNLLVWAWYPGVSTCSTRPSRWNIRCCGSFPGTAGRQEVPNCTAVILTKYLKSLQANVNIVPLRQPQLPASKFLSTHYSWFFHVIWCYTSITFGFKTPLLYNLTTNQSISGEVWLETVTLSRTLSEGCVPTLMAAVSKVSWARTH